jgi:hypothetical protein
MDRVASLRIGSVGDRGPKSISESEIPTVLSPKVLTAGGGVGEGDAST